MTRLPRVEPASRDADVVPIRAGGLTRYRCWVTLNVANAQNWSPATPAELATTARRHLDRGLAGWVPLSEAIRTAAASLLTAMVLGGPESGGTPDDR